MLILIGELAVAALGGAAFLPAVGRKIKAAFVSEGDKLKAKATAATAVAVKADATNAVAAIEAKAKAGEAIVSADLLALVAKVKAAL